MNKRQRLEKDLSELAFEFAQDILLEIAGSEINQKQLRTFDSLSDIEKEDFTEFSTKIIRLISKHNIEIGE
jgi:hypothetical protein